MHVVPSASELVNYMLIVWFAVSIHRADFKGLVVCSGVLYSYFFIVGPYSTWEGSLHFKVPVHKKEQGFSQLVQLIKAATSIKPPRPTTYLRTMFISPAYFGGFISQYPKLYVLWVIFPNSNFKLFCALFLPSIPTCVIGLCEKR